MSPRSGRCPGRIPLAAAFLVCIRTSAEPIQRNQFLPPPACLQLESRLNQQSGPDGRLAPTWTRGTEKGR